MWVKKGRTNILFHVTLNTFLWLYGIEFIVKYISRSSQCPTTGVTKAIVYIILSVG